MKLMSFSMTTEAFERCEKTVTRRLGWWNLKPGELLQGVEQAQGLRKGEHVVKGSPACLPVASSPCSATRTGCCRRPRSTVSSSSTWRVAHEPLPLSHPRPLLAHGDVLGAHTKRRQRPGCPPDLYAMREGEGPMTDLADRLRGNVDEAGGVTLTIGDGVTSVSLEVTL